VETGDMQIRLLGSVDVELNGRPVKLGGPKQRAVLAMLALNANTTVSLERLIDGLWGEEPPSTAVKMVQQYVSQLRRLVADEGTEIVTRGRGYELRIDPVAVDALRFERLVERAAEDRDGARSELAREALALWLGPPLAGMLEEPFAASEARRLEELHLAAIELSLEGELGAGREAQVIGRLGALVDEHPLRERLRGLLMLALYRAGRQADALDAFRDARWTLVEQLGLEPGPELRRLQEAILRQDPALDLVVPDEAWADRETVQQVDARAGRASQRRTELRAIEHELAGKTSSRAYRGRACSASSARRAAGSPQRSAPACCTPWQRACCRAASAGGGSCCGPASGRPQRCGAP
jgi:DNA-binding SARP family transcriptional activator